MDFVLRQMVRRQRVPCTIFSKSWWHPSSAFSWLPCTKQADSDFLVGGWTASFGSKGNFFSRSREDAEGTQLT